MVQSRGSRSGAELVSSGKKASGGAFMLLTRLLYTGLLTSIRDRPSSNSFLQSPLMSETFN